MGSLFYNRYIPPSHPDSSHLETDRPSKKCRIAKVEPRVISKPPSLGGDEDTLNALSNNLEGLDLPRKKHSHDKVRSKFTKAKEHSIQPSREDTAPVLPEEPPIEPHGLEPLPQPSQSEDLLKVNTFSALPDWLRNPIIVSNKNSRPFKKFHLLGSLITALKQQSYEDATPIQQKVLELLIPGPKEHYYDLCIQAATGSGKTLAYALPMIHDISKNCEHRLLALVVLPTRELVGQTLAVLRSLAQAPNIDLKVESAVGSKALKEEAEKLVERYQRYDPEAYKAEQEKHIDEDELLMDWDFDAMIQPPDGLPYRPNFVVDYRSKVDILVCTPGRLVEHMQSTRGFNVHDVKWFIVDEVDKLLAESFHEWVNVIMSQLEYMPPLSAIEQKLGSPFLRRRELRKVLLSATMTRDMDKLSALKLRRPKMVHMENSKGDDKPTGKPEDHVQETVELPTTLQEVAVSIKEVADKPMYLIKTLEKPVTANMEIATDRGSEQRQVETVGQDALSDSYLMADDTSSSSESEDYSQLDDGSNRALERNLGKKPSTHGTLIFTKSNENAFRLARLLSILRPDWATQLSTLTSSSTSAKGRKMLKAFEKHKLSIIVASDRASRGLDMQDLNHVINYDMPKSLVDYVHRVGRTARAGKAGLATTFVEHQQGRWFWNVIGRSEKVVRGPGTKVQRLDAELDLSEMERERYQDALTLLGAEAQSSVAGKAPSADNARVG